MTTPPQITEADRDALLRAAARFTANLQRAVEMLAPMYQALGEQLAQLQQILTAGGYLGPDGKPTRPTDRPAWQSPYGPPARRH